MMIRARAPLRLGLAGGGTDVSPYCDQYGGYVLNATIDRYAYAVIKPLDDQVVRFIASDRQSTVELPLQASYPLDGDLALHKAVYNEIVTNYNGGKPLAIELTTFCDSPIGSGLGSSSTVVVVGSTAVVDVPVVVGSGPVLVSDPVVVGTVEVVVCPTVREASGLARSSRNLLLSPEARQEALALSRALRAARDAWERGERDAAALGRVLRAALASPALEVEYAEVRDPERWTAATPAGAMARAVA